MSKSTKAWLTNLLRAVIAGAAGMVVAWTGLATANKAGVDVPMLNFKGLGIVLLSGAIVNAFIFLNKEPLPKSKQEADENPPPALLH